MNSMNNADKKLIFDYSFDLLEKAESDKAKSLIEQNDEAQNLFNSLEKTLSPLNDLQPEQCPQDLEEKTIQKLLQAANSAPKADKGHIKLKSLLYSEQQKTESENKSIWPRFGQIAAVAAIILFAMGVLFPSLNHMRYLSFKQQCQA